MAILHEVSEQELRVRLEEPVFADKVRNVLRAFDRYMTERPTWGDLHAAALRANPVAYFSAEFGFHETLPIAAGGLGILAGDHAKSASDSGIGFVGVSLFYRQGYFQQAIDGNNWQTEYYTLLNPKNLPVEPVLGPGGEPIVCQVDIGMSPVSFQAWRANVGRVPVYLLDTNRPENEPHLRTCPAGLWRGYHHAHYAGGVAGHRRLAPAARVGRAAVGLPYERGTRRFSDSRIAAREDGWRQESTTTAPPSPKPSASSRHTRRWKPATTDSIPP